MRLWSPGRNYALSRTNCPRGKLRWMINFGIEMFATHFSRKLKAVRYLPTWNNRVFTHLNDVKVFNRQTNTFSLQLTLENKSLLLFSAKWINELESIPVGCLLYVASHQMSALVGRTYTMRSSSEQVWAGIQCWPPDVIRRRVGPGTCTEGVCTGGPVQRGRDLYSEVRWYGTPLWTEWLTDRHNWKHYLPGTLWVNNKTNSMPLILWRIMIYLFNHVMNK